MPRAIAMVTTHRVIGWRQSRHSPLGLVLMQLRAMLSLDLAVVVLALLPVLCVVLRATLLETTHSTSWQHYGVHRAPLVSTNNHCSRLLLW